ncbi:MAG TPA: MgtC/SapB family protein [Anaerolineaceae bacterium]|nr:MgtC/SapB family protein [Anaerolineaceae bacterium]HPN52508.1 MgtC/SapB family protein [Anaerolineaceae bacterium]
MISETDIAIRLVVAALLGALIGLDRERQNQPAGLRTHIILVTGAALAMILSINMSMQFNHIAPNGDPSRLAAQVLSGIGFLGAGAIMRYGPNIKGLTTATSLWTMAVVGLAVGAGYIWVAVGTSAFLFAALSVLSKIEKNKLTVNVVRQLSLSYAFHPGIEESLHTILAERTKNYTITRMERNVHQNRLRITVMIRLKSTENLTPLVDELATMPGIRGIRVE